MKLFLEKPIVRAIAQTTFDCVPQELMPVDEDGDYDYEKVAEKHQDEGSEMARLIECAGRTCYDSLGQGRASSEYHTHIKEVGHGSVTAHGSISFYLDDISRGCTHELVRHNVGCAISQRSTRYVDESSSPWVLHPVTVKYSAKYPRLTESAGKLILLARDTYDEHVAILQQALIEDGVDKFTARKQARGAARGMLGNALCTAMVWTANIRALRNCIEQRANPAADAEIRVLFNRIYEEALTICPEYFNDYERVECVDGIGYGLVTKYRKI